MYRLARGIFCLAAASLEEILCLDNGVRFVVVVAMVEVASGVAGWKKLRLRSRRSNAALERYTP